jgi:hypothetical protein
MTSIQQNGDEERPWERPGAVRRDVLPHRAEFLSKLAVVAVVLAFCTWLGGIAGPFCLALSITAWVMATRDLTRMRQGLMDPEGRKMTILARNRAIAATIVALLLMLVWLFIVNVLSWLPASLLQGS